MGSFEAPKKMGKPPPKGSAPNGAHGPMQGALKKVAFGVPGGKYKFVSAESLDWKELDPTTVYVQVLGTGFHLTSEFDANPAKGFQRGKSKDYLLKDKKTGAYTTVKKNVFEKLYK